METKASSTTPGKTEDSTTSPHPRALIAPAWVRFIFPSITDLILVLLLAALMYGVLSQRLLNDADTGWHIRNGQEILSNHTLPRTDAFSATMSGKPWYAWEWLYDLVIGGIYHATGLNGVVFFSALVIALTFALAFRLLLRRGANVAVAVVLLLLAASASTIHFLARPHIVSWLFASIFFASLDASELDPRPSPSPRKKLYWLPVLMLLWANLHGGFLLGVVLLGVYLVAASIQYFWSRDVAERSSAKKRLRVLGAISGLCLLASLANPYGYKLHMHIYKYLSNRFLMDHIDEFRSPNFHAAAEKCFAALLLIVIFTLAVSGRRLRASHWMLLLFATYAGLYASRNIPIASILLTLVTAPLLSQLITTDGSALVSRESGFVTALESFSARMLSIESQLRGHFWPVVVVLLSAWICLHQGRLGSRQIMNAHFDARKFPAQAVDVLISQNVHAPIFSFDSWGGYLIYRLYPQTKVVVDDRHDLYGADFFKQYLKVYYVEPGWESVLDSWSVNWALLPPKSALSSVLKENPHWQLVYDDGVGILFRRKGSGPESGGRSIGAGRFARRRLPTNRQSTLID